MSDEIRRLSDVLREYFLEAVFKLRHLSCEKQAKALGIGRATYNRKLVEYNIQSKRHYVKKRLDEEAILNKKNDDELKRKEYELRFKNGIAILPGGRK